MSIQKYFNIFGRISRTSRSTLLGSVVRSAISSPQSNVQTQRDGKVVKRSVILSQSTDPFTNLAFEEWICENRDLMDEHILFLWQNEPSVVIGRHQNPWKECDVKTLLKKYGYKIVRRRSGGGAVYHDLGNLNITFFTPKEFYDRRRNLQIIVDAITKSWDVDVSINCRHDLILDKTFKISGSSARISKKNCYHHCTLMFASKTEIIPKILHMNNTSLECRATDSVRSPVSALQNVEPAISRDGLVYSIVNEYLRGQPHTNLTFFNEYQMMNEHNYPGVQPIRTYLQDWDWIFGKTPRFTIEGVFSSPSSGKIVITVNRGLIEDITVEGMGIDNCNLELNTYLKGIQFWKHPVLTVLGHHVERFRYRFGERNWEEMRVHIMGLIPV